MVQVFMLATALILGDSHANGPPGAALANGLRDYGFEVATVAQDGAGACRVAEMGKEIDAEYDVVVVIVGTNDLASKRTRGCYEQIRSRWPTVVVVGPPSFPKGKKDPDGRDLNRSKSLVVRLQRDVFWIRYIDSRPKTDDIMTTREGREPDGIHFKPKGAQLWMDRVLDDLEYMLPENFR